MNVGEKRPDACLMIAYTYYQSDPRVIREAEAAVAAGMEVDFFALRRPGDPPVQVLRGVTVYHLLQSRYRGGDRLLYMIAYLRFFILCFIKTSVQFLKRRYRVIHVNNMPDFLVFSTVVAKVFGAKIILDIHDPMPNTFASKFGSEERGFFCRILLWQELLSSSFANQVITMPGGRADDAGGAQGSPSAPRRTIVLVYLFLDESPRFPHAWLNVTCPKTRIGRITNYAAIHDEMVPKGKTSLCCEFYCNEGERLLERTNDELVALALTECLKSTLIEDSAHCFDNLVLRLPGADASQNRHNWMARMKASFLDDLKQFQNLYFVSRTDLDIATLAGLESGEAILTGDRTKFDRHIDPSELPIRSVKKTFEFKNPADQDSFSGTGTIV